MRELIRLQRLFHLQARRVEVQNAFDTAYHIPSSTYAREVRVLLRIVDAWMRWVDVPSKQQDDHSASNPTSPDQHKSKEYMRRVAAIQTLEEKSDRIWGILLRDTEIEIEDKVLHPQGWTTVRDALNAINKVLQLHSEAGLLGQNIRTSNEDDQSIPERFISSAIAC